MCNRGGEKKILEIVCEILNRNPLSSDFLKYGLWPNDKSYGFCLSEAAVVPLEERRVTSCKKLFSEMQHCDHVLHDLLPALRSNSRSLRSHRARELPLCHTCRAANSFIYSCLKYFQ